MIRRVLVVLVPPSNSGKKQVAKICSKLVEAVHAVNISTIVPAKDSEAPWCIHAELSQVFDDLRRVPALTGADIANDDYCVEDADSAAICYNLMGFFSSLGIRGLIVHDVAHNYVYVSGANGKLSMRYDLSEVIEKCACDICNLFNYND